MSMAEDSETDNAHTLKSQMNAAEDQAVRACLRRLGVAAGVIERIMFR